MSRQIVVTKTAKKNLLAMDPLIRKRLLSKIQFFGAQTDPLFFAKKLVDFEDGGYRWRVGNYRVVFDVDKENIVILRVQHRKNVYRK